jgi:hypothetical protein
MRCGRMLGKVCLIALLAAPGSLMFPQTSEASHAGPRNTRHLPWYVTAAAIHRVSMKPNTQFWQYEHLSLKLTESQAQLRA